MNSLPALPGVVELGQHYRSGTLTPSEAVEIGLARLLSLEPRLNAFADPMAAAARADAKRRTEELRTGLDLGPLHGIPVAIKDLMDVEGVPTGYGTRATAPRVATRDAELVRRLRSAGAVIFGKTNLLEFAYGVAHPQVGQTNNPHDPGRTAGGSSGGAAAAVAAGIVPLAIGTDTGGSIRIPASYCGVVGLKPTFGLVPVEGVFPLSPTLDHAGPLAASVADIRLALAVLAATPMGAATGAARDLRVGVIARHWNSHEIEPGVRAALTLARERIAAVASTVEEVDIDGLHRAKNDLMAIVLPEAALVHQDLYRTNPGGYAPQTLAQIEAGFRQPAIDYLRALDFRTRLRAAVDSAFERFDVLMSPSVPYVAPVTDPLLGDGEEGELLSAGFANISGHPAISLPAGRVNGLPVGLQLLGRFGRDDELLAAAAAIEPLIR